MTSDPPLVFISYNSADRKWAEWMAWVLEEAGFSVVVQAWDIRPGHNFVLAMQNATARARHTVIVLSPSFLEADYTPSEWAAAFSRDARGRHDHLFVHTARTFESFCRLAGEVELADRVRESQKLTRRTANETGEGEVPQPLPEGDGSDPVADLPEAMSSVPEL